VVTNPGSFEALALTPDGQTVRGDHAYVQYQAPVGPRRLPLVMWHGRGQSAKTWETTPDGRQGFQTLFLRRGFRGPRRAQHRTRQHLPRDRPR
jgi:hypothetical protein